MKPYYDREFSKEDAEDYIKIYVDFRHFKDDSKNKDSKKKADELAEELKAIEGDYAYEKIAALRQVAFNKHMMEKRKEEERKQIDQKGTTFVLLTLIFIVQEFSQSKKGVMSSVKGFFGFANREKEEQNKKEVLRLQEDLDNEFLNKYEVEEEKLNKEIDEFLTKKSSFDPDVVEEMPGDWTRFKFNLNVPETRFALLKAESTPENISKILELKVTNIFANVKIGRFFEDIILGMQEANLLDHVSSSQGRAVYILENIFTEKGK